MEADHSHHPVERWRLNRHRQLSLTEGRNTGIPTIQRELAINGSSIATFETDEDRLSFLVRIPCHEGEEGIPSVFSNDKEIPKETKEYDKERYLGNKIQLIYSIRNGSYCSVLA